MSETVKVPCDFLSQGPCFARHIGLNGKPYCELLSSRITTGRCNFCKPDRAVTDGIRYDRFPKGVKVE